MALATALASVGLGSIFTSTATDMGVKVVTDAYILPYFSVFYTDLFGGV